MCLIHVILNVEELLSSALCACLDPVKALPRSLPSSHQPQFISSQKGFQASGRTCVHKAVVIKFLLAYPSIPSLLSKCNFPKWSTLFHVCLLSKQVLQCPKSHSLSLFTYSQIFIKSLLYTRHCSKPWEESFLGAYILLEETDD